MMTKDRLRQLTGDERLGQMRESEYLGAEDIDDGVEPVLTIAGLWYGSVTLQRGKENKDVLSFTEERVPGVMQVRPLIVNSTNRKTLRKLFGDAKASTLVGKQIQLFVDHNVRDPQDGGMTDGIRIRPYGTGSNERLKRRISMKVIYKAPGCAPEPRDIPNTLEELQATVGGYIETVTFASDALVICNEEGRLQGLPHNCRFLGVDFVGPILIVGRDDEDFTDLRPEYFATILDALKEKRKS